MPRPLRPPRLEIDDHGRWRVSYFDAAAKQTRRYALGTQDRAEAERRFARFLLKKGEVEALDASGVLTVTAALTHYWNGHVTGLRRDGTAKVIDHERIDVTIRNLELWFAGKPVQELCAADVNAYSQKRASGVLGYAQGGQAGPKPVKDGTIRRELQTLVAALYWCQKTGRLGPFDFTQIDVGDAPPARFRVLSREEWGRLLGAATFPRLHRFLMLGLHAPARRRSIEALMWSQVDRQARVIDFNPAGARQSNKRKPTVPISDDLWPVIDRAFREKTSLYVLDHSGSIRTAFENAVERAGLAGTGVLCHTLRHTYATWALQGGAPIWQVAKMLGDSVATVERNYAHGHPEYLREAMLQAVR